MNKAGSPASLVSPWQSYPFLLEGCRFPRRSYDKQRKVPAIAFTVHFTRRLIMASVSTYLSFPRTCEEAFEFYKSVFRSDFQGSITRMGDTPSDPNNPVPEADRHLICNVSLPITGGHILMGADACEWMGPFIEGNNISLTLHPESKEETDRLFAALSEGGKVDMPMQD